MRADCIISIDPGLEIGWAAWNVKNWEKKCAPMQTGILRTRPTEGEEWPDYFLKVMRNFHNFLWRNGYEIDGVYIESPVVGGKISSMESFVKLSVLTGALMECCHLTVHAWPELVPVIKWKGQLPKPIVIKRITKLLGKKACKGFKSHVWDAVGIGLYAKGFEI